MIQMPPTPEEYHYKLPLSHQGIEELEELMLLGKYASPSKAVAYAVGIDMLIQEMREGNGKVYLEKNGRRETNLIPPAAEAFLDEANPVTTLTIRLSNAANRQLEAHAELNGYHETTDVLVQAIRNNLLLQQRRVDGWRLYVSENGRKMEIMLDNAQSKGRT